MRNERTPFEAWLRRDLSDRYSLTLREPIPEELLALLDKRD